MQKQTARRRPHKGGCTGCAHEEPGRDGRWLIFSTTQRRASVVYLASFCALASPRMCDVPSAKTRVTTNPTAITARHLLHERAAATLCDPRLLQRTWLLVSAFIQSNHGWPRLHQATLARRWLTVTKSVTSDTSVDAASGDGLTRLAFCRIESHHRQGHEKSGRFWGPFWSGSHVKAGPPPHREWIQGSARHIRQRSRKGTQPSSKRTDDRGAANNRLIDS